MRRWFAGLLLLLTIACAASAAGGQIPPANLERRAAELRKTLPPQFHVLIEAPFVVVGDQEPDAVRGHAEGTVRWAVERLKRDYFPNDPAGIFTIWLFGSTESYQSNTEKFFGQKPISPFGFCLNSRRALVMNITTGGGTLVHEMVHAFMESNFPECPVWFNEGLGSLYEQSRNKEGHIFGLTNWRLARLQRAIAAKELPSFETLLAMSATEFYDKDKGTNYAQARYLLYYLQERGLLAGFYREFHEQVKKDPTGVATLRKTLGRDDLAAFQKEWEAFVMKLTFP